MPQTQEEREAALGLQELSAKEILALTDRERVLYFERQDAVQARATQEAAKAKDTGEYDDIHDPGRIPANRFQTIVADPPWKVSFPVPYPTMPTPHIRRMAQHRPTCWIGGEPTPGCKGCGILQAAHTNCHLYLWAVNNMLEDALLVMHSWGFRHVNTVTWNKTIKGGIQEIDGRTWISGDHSGQGTYFRGTTELLLLGVKGSLPMRAPGKYDTQLYAPRSGHSAKPDDIFWPMIMELSPGPYLEVFARRLWKGLDAKKKDVAWGNQSPDEVH